MKRNRFILSLACSLVFVSALTEAGDWPVWRGPNLNGVADPGQKVPVSWDETEHVLWKAEVPGRGHSSPIIVGDRLLLTSADESAQVQSVLCFDRRDGRMLWQTEISRGGFPEQIHRKNTHATPTLGWSGERLFVLFNNHDRVQLTALTIEGEQLWQIDAGGYNPDRYKYGFASSPLLYESLVIVASEYERGWLAAFDQRTGREVWRVPRPDNVSYSSPIVATLGGRDQMLLSGNDQVTAFDPLSGQQLWAAQACTKATCGTLVWENGLVFVSGGFPDRETAAVRADGSGDVVWRNTERCYEQSLLVHNGYLYAFTDNGIAFCWRAADGEEMWRQRLSGPVSASPILAGGNIYASNERGTTFVFRANPDEFQLVAENQLGDEAFASPTICGNRIYLRVAHHRGDDRVEMLYCIGLPDEGGT